MTDLHDVDLDVSAARLVDEMERGIREGTMGRSDVDRLKDEIDELREREVDVARALDCLGEARVDLPRFARNMRHRAERAEAEAARLRWVAAAVVQAVDADPDVKITEIKVYPDGAAHWLQEYARAVLFPAQPEEPTS